MQQVREPQLERRHIAYVDGLRACAVLTVLLGHAAPAVVPWGMRGVDLFFVISGFCLAFPFLQGKRIDYGAFLRRRFVRIAPPYYAALLLFGALALTPFGYPSVLPGSVGSPQAQALEFIGDFAFAIPRINPIHSVAFWTLAIEARWYLVCPLLIALYRRSRPLFFVLGLLLYALYFWTPSATDEGTLPCFMAGIVAADLAINPQPWQRYAWIGAVLTLALGLALRPHVVADPCDPLWHAASFFFVVAGGTGVLAKVLAWRPMVAVGLASYSIYLIHAPFVGYLHSHGCPRPVTFLIALGLGFAFWRLVERPAMSAALRNRLERVLRAPLWSAPRLEGDGGNVTRLK
ncbi:MAG: acyltransferase family protein [Vulcanimicrobiaceae bacterium]